MQPNTLMPQWKRLLKQSKRSKNKRLKLNKISLRPKYTTKGKWMTWCAKDTNNGKSRNRNSLIWRWTNWKPKLSKQPNKSKWNNKTSRSRKDWEEKENKEIRKNKKKKDKKGLIISVLLQAQRRRTIRRAQVGADALTKPKSTALQVKHH